MSNQSLAHKWALVTGAAQRIGRAIALELAAGGWDIAVHYNNSAEEAEATVAKIKLLKRKAIAIKCDFTNKRETEGFVASVAEAIGAPLAALVNNASLFQPDASAPGGHKQKAVTLEAPLLLIDAFRKQLPRGSKGAVVNILDGCMPSAGFHAYTQSKKSLRVLTIEQARRLAPDVRVNGVAPGPVLPGTRQSAAHFKEMLGATLLKTEISPQSIASAVRLLLENPSITGEILHIDGGIRLQNTPAIASRMAG
jgi:NAD(P)-dependent dehydrogenase (short-subunit alcohol dehydrogenase family)